MIARILGKLDDLRGDTAWLALAQGEGELVYEVLLPPYAVGRLGGSIGEMVTLYTLHYLESHNQGASFIPRLAGFLSPDDRAFFELFTTTKGVGNRKALRAMAMSTDQIARAIADRDVSLLATLPEVGKRTAETIIVSLSGKVDRFLVAPRSTSETAGAKRPVGESPATDSFARQAVEVMVSLGESRSQAAQWVDQVLFAAAKDEESITDVEALLQRAFRMRDR